MKWFYTRWHVWEKTEFVCLSVCLSVGLSVYPAKPVGEFL